MSVVRSSIHFFCWAYSDLPIGIDSPDSGAGGKRHSTGQLDNEENCASDNVQGSHTPRNFPVVQRSVENPRDPQHLDKWSKTSSGKVLLQWYDGENHSTFFLVPHLTNRSLFLPQCPQKLCQFRFDLKLRV